MRLIFAGTPEFARVALQALHAAGHTVPLVLTQPDRPAGRGLKLQPSAVKQFAQAHGLPVAQPRSLRLDGKYPEDAALGRAAIEAAQADVMVVAAYGLILPQWVLDAPRSAARTSSTPRCCHAGAAPPRSTVPWRQEMRKPASRSCKWMPVSTPARCCWPSPWPSAPRTPRPPCTTVWRRWAQTHRGGVGARRARRPPPGHPAQRGRDLCPQDRQVRGRCGLDAGGRSGGPQDPSAGSRPWRSAR